MDRSELIRERQLEEMKGHFGLEFQLLCKSVGCLVISPCSMVEDSF